MYSKSFGALCTLTGTREMKRIIVAIAILGLLIAGLYVWKSHSELPEVVASQPPVIEITPEVLKAINQKLAIVKVEVPLNRIDVPIPDRTALWGYHSIESGVFWTSGRLFVAFERGRVETDECGCRVVIFLGKPVIWGLDDHFTTEVHNTSAFWSVDPHFVDNAREKGRQMLLSEACADGSYDKASAAATSLMTDFVKDIAPNATVVVNSAPAQCKV